MMIPYILLFFRCLCKIAREFRMLDFARFIGFFLCHAIWSVSDGEMLIPFRGDQTPTDRNLTRYTGDNQEMVTQLERELQSPTADVVFRVMCYDGFFTNQGVRRDSIYARACHYLSGGTSEVFMIVPYLPAHPTPTDFKVFRPKYISMPTTTDIGPFTEALWEGIFAHQQGATVWNTHMDQSE